LHILSFDNIFVTRKYYKNTNKMTTDELKLLLDTGDYVKIARIVGYSNLTYGRTYVYRVLSGRITGTKGMAKEIIKAAHVVAERNRANGKLHDPQPMYHLSQHTKSQPAN